MCRSKIINAFSIVARAQSITGRKNTSRKSDPLNMPARAPVKVRIREFNPRGAAERKSRNKPEKNPDTCPTIVPFIYAEKTRMQSAKSGMTLKKAN